MKNVRLSRLADRKLREIWDWNAASYGSAHANRYLLSLRDWLRSMGEDPPAGRAVDETSDLRYVEFRKRRRGHGYVAIYRINEHDILIIDLFHTAQDWRSRLDER